MSSRAEEVLAFWFEDAAESAEAALARCVIWFQEGPSLDAPIEDRFSELPERARAGAFDDWLESPRSALALLLLLDQFPRHLFRDSPEAFAYDSRARDICRRMLSLRFDESLAPIETCFAYLPLEHSEDIKDQERCVALFDALITRCDASMQPILEGSADYARRHYDVIRRFGRFPHRNPILGREHRPEEIAYLEGGGDTF